MTEMPGIAVVILLLAGGLALCVKGRAAGPAAVFSGLLVLFTCSTPVFSGLPGAVAAVMSVVDGAASPVLAGERPDHGDAGGDERERPISHEDGDEESGSGVRQVGVDR